MPILLRISPPACPNAPPNPRAIPAGLTCTEGTRPSRAGGLVRSRTAQAIPPTVDQQGFVLLMQNAAVLSSIDVVTITPTTPVFYPATGLSTITNAISVTGS